MATCPAMPGATVEERALNLLPHILDYHGEIPVGDELAIAEHESVNFTKFLGPTVKACGAMGNAVGVWQVMSSCFSSYGLTWATACDWRESTRKVNRVLAKNRASMLALAPEAEKNAQLHAYLLYVSHHAGRGGMESLIRRAIKASGQPLTVESINAAADASYAAGYYTVSQRALYWEQWAAPATRVYEAPNPWVTPMLLTATALVATALGTAIYLNHTGSRSRWVHWSPARA